jgi:hypothetical protein
VASKDTNLMTALKMLIRSKGIMSMKRHLLLLHLIQVALPLYAISAKNLDTEKECYKMKKIEVYSIDYVDVMLLVTEYGLLTKRPHHVFTENTFIADSGPTCHV